MKDNGYVELTERELQNWPSDNLEGLFNLTRMLDAMSLAAKARLDELSPGWEVCEVEEE